MKIQFKVQQYQSDAVAAVADCFAGQPHQSPVDYKIDPGVREKGRIDKTSGKEQLQIDQDVEMETGTGKTYCSSKPLSRRVWFDFGLSATLGFS